MQGLCSEFQMKGADHYLMNPIQHTLTISHIHSGYTCSELTVLRFGSIDLCSRSFVLTPNSITMSTIGFQKFDGAIATKWLRPNV